MVKLTWKQHYKIKKPGSKKKVERSRECSAFFTTKEAAESAIKSTPPEAKCYDFEIEENANYSG